MKAKAFYFFKVEGRRMPSANLTRRGAILLYCLFCILPSGLSFKPTALLPPSPPPPRRVATFLINSLLIATLASPPPSLASPVDATALTSVKSEIVRTMFAPLPFSSPALAKAPSITPSNCTKQCLKECQALAPSDTSGYCKVSCDDYCQNLDTDSKNNIGNGDTK